MKYSIKVDVCLGFSHCGGVTTKGEGFVELSDEEVQTLVELMKSKKTTEASDLGLKRKHPDLYSKLNSAYSEAACYAEKRHWIMDGFKQGEGEYYDLDEAKKYCIEQGLYVPYECSESLDYFYDDEEEEEDDEKYNDENDNWDFCQWLCGYLEDLDNKTVCDFFYEHINNRLDLDDIEYDVIDIPEEIKQMVDFC